MLFASSDGSFGLLLMFCFFFYATNRAVKKISGSPVARSAVSKGASHLIGRLFK